jgi:hypothetical protein
MIGENPSLDPELDARLKSAQAQKTELESRLLEKQLSHSHQRLETFKAFSSASGLVLALVAVVGGLLSVFAWFIDRSRERDHRTQERLERALVGLLASSPEQRVASAPVDRRGCMTPIGTPSH